MIIIHPVSAGSIIPSLELNIVETIYIFYIFNKIHSLHLLSHDDVFMIIIHACASRKNAVEMLHLSLELLIIDAYYCNAYWS